MALPQTFSGTTGASIQTLGFVKRSADTDSLIITAAGRCRPKTDPSSCQYTWPTDLPPNANYSVSLDYVFLSNTVTRMGVIGRASVDSRDFYLARVYQVGSTAVIQLWVTTTAGGFQQLGTDYTLSPIANGKLTLDMNGSTIRALWNDVEVRSVTNSAITTAGRAGLYITADVQPQSDSTCYHTDNFTTSYAGVVPMVAAGSSSGVATSALTTAILLNAASGAGGIATASFDAATISLNCVAESRSDSSSDLTTQILLSADAIASSSALTTLPELTTSLLYNFAGANADGSLSTITNATSSTPTVTIRVRSPEDQEWQQALLGLGDVANKDLAVEILLTEKEDDPDSYKGTWEGPYWSPNPSAPISQWTNIPAWSQVAGDRVSFSLNPGANNTVYIATVPPWNTDIVAAWIAELAANYPTLIHDDVPSRVAFNNGAYVCALSGTGTDENGRQISNLPLYAFRLANDAIGSQPKRRIVIFSGVHSGEWNGPIMLRGFVNEILTGPHSAALLANFDFYIYPLHSVKGNYLGFRRSEAAASYFNHADANREWADGDTTSATVVQWQGILDFDHGVNHAQKVKGFIDFHDGKSASDIAWFYYQTGQPNVAAYAALVAAENATIISKHSAIAGSTMSYWWVDKGAPFTWTVEAADENSTVAQVMSYGAAIARSIKTANDAGYIPQFETLSSQASASGNASTSLDVAIQLEADAISLSNSVTALDTSIGLLSVGDVSGIASTELLVEDLGLVCSARADSDSSTALDTSVLLASNGTGRINSITELMTAISLAADGESGSFAIAELLLEDLGLVSAGSAKAEAYTVLQTAPVFSSIGLGFSLSWTVLGNAPAPGEDPPPHGRVVLTVKNSASVSVSIKTPSHVSV